MSSLQKIVKAVFEILIFILRSHIWSPYPTSNFLDFCRSLKTIYAFIWYSVQNLVFLSLLVSKI